MIHYIRHDHRTWVLDRGKLLKFVNEHNPRMSGFAWIDGFCFSNANLSVIVRILRCTCSFLSCLGNSLNAALFYFYFLGLATMCSCWCLFWTASITLDASNISLMECVSQHTTHICICVWGVASEACLWFYKKWVGGRWKVQGRWARQRPARKASRPRDAEYSSPGQRFTPIIWANLFQTW